MSASAIHQSVEVETSCKDQDSGYVNTTIEDPELTLSRRNSTANEIDATLAQDMSSIHIHDHYPVFDEKSEDEEKAPEDPQPEDPLNGKSSARYQPQNIHVDSNPNHHHPTVPAPPVQMPAPQEYYATTNPMYSVPQYQVPQMPESAPYYPPQTYAQPSSFMPPHPSQYYQPAVNRAVPYYDNYGQPYTYSYCHPHQEYPEMIPTQVPPQCMHGSNCCAMPQQYVYSQPQYPAPQCVASGAQPYGSAYAHQHTGSAYAPQHIHHFPTQPVYTHPQPSVPGQHIPMAEYKTVHPSVHNMHVHTGNGAYSASIPDPALLQNARQSSVPLPSGSIPAAPPKPRSASNSDYMVPRTGSLLTMMNVPTPEPWRHRAIPMEQRGRLGSTLRGPTGANLFVGNLSPSVTETDLYNCFCKMGTVVSVKVVRDAVTKNPVGHGFVSYSSAEHASRAVNFFDGKILNDQKIQVHLKKD